MSSSNPRFAAEQLAEHVEFVTRLSRSLIADEQIAVDAAQETFVAALQRPPVDTTNPRAWLAAVLRRTVSRLRRTAGRRAVRERRTIAGGPSEPAGDAAERLELHRDLAGLVLRLAEPYRTAITLRYLDGLDVDEVAQQTGVPKNTARSHLTRGLSQLRKALDSRHGERRAWVGLLVPLARRPIGVGSTTLALTLGVVVKKSVGVAAVALFGLSLVGVLLWRGDGAVAAVPDGDAARVAAARGPSDPRLDSPPAAAADPLQRAAVVEVSVAEERAGIASPLRRVVDLRREPLAGLRVRREGEWSVRWQGGDAGWIAGPGESLRLSPDDVGVLRTDPEKAREFFAARQQPEQWRATILGTPLPQFEVATDASGQFDFGEHEPIAVNRVAIADPDWTLLARPAQLPGEFLAARSAPLAGRLVDPQGQPIRNGFVNVDLRHTVPANAGYEPVRFPEMRTDRRGRFLIREAPLAGGARLRARAQGFATAIVPIPDGPFPADYEIRLWPRGDDERLLVAGTVVDIDGAPVRALVAVGRESVQTDANGSFRLQFDEVPTTASLTVVARGWQAEQVRFFGRRLADDANAGRRLRIVLQRRAHALTGQVLRPDGSPLAGAGINLADPTLLDYSFTSVEARTGGRKRSSTTDDAGRFDLGGLGERSYHLRIWDPRTGFATVVGPFDPRVGPVVVQLGDEARERQLTGRVVVADGGAVPSGTVKLAFCTYVGRTGGTMWDDGLEVPLGSDGRFTFDAAPRGAGAVVFEAADGQQAVRPLATVADGQEIELRLPERVRWLRLLPDAGSSQLPVAFVDADGQPQQVRVWDAAGERDAWSTRVSAMTTVRLPASVIAVWIAPRTPLERRITLDQTTTHVLVRGGS
ncbi:MAG: sigma-70 family RNA polymerase sigma factor [bacterium]|nr:sigma-70 family RNA polymerase sigma factor [bacterium]